MAKLLGAVPRQNFELIRDKVAQILIEEFQAQLIYSGDYDLDLNGVFIERLVPFSHTELPALNIGLERGDEESSHQGQSEWTYRYFIETNTKGKTDDDNRGDTLAKMMSQKIMGVARAILENPAYVTLGFPRGQLIRHRHIESFVFAESTRQDAENTNMARMILVVKTVEKTELKDTVPLLESNTTVKLFETSKGFYWAFESSDELTTDDDENLTTGEGEDLIIS
jgi:hypothetical protein